MENGSGGFLSNLTFIGGNFGYIYSYLALSFPLIDTNIEAQGILRKSAVHDVSTQLSELQNCITNPLGLGMDHARCYYQQLHTRSCDSRRGKHTSKHGSAIILNSSHTGWRLG